MRHERRILLQLGRRGLYAAFGQSGYGSQTQRAVQWLLNQSNGRRGLLEIAERSGLELDTGGLRVRFGPWLVETPLDNIAGAEATGPFSPLRALGVRLSLADRGLTFGTTTRGGVCLRFRDPVPGIEPWGVLRHPGLTVTVAEPELVAATINRIVS